jgi:hypothetical protein
MVLNGVKGPVYERVERPVHSARGGVVAYRAVANHRAFVVVGKEKQEEFIEVDEPVLSPDWARVAYRAHHSDGMHFVVGKKRGDAYVEVDPPFFTPVGAHAVARVRTQEGPGVAIDEKLYTSSKQAPFVWVGPITSTRNGAKVAFPAVEKGKTWRELWWEVFP